MAARSRGILRTAQLKIALAQIKPALGNLEHNFKLHVQKINQAKKEKCDLVVFPELSLTGYFLRDQVIDIAISLKHPYIQHFLKESKHISLVVGFVEQSPDLRLFNAVAYFEKGKISHIHRKIYLPTYGLFDEQRYLSEGDRIRAFDSKLGRTAMMICEDFWHPMVPYTAIMDKAHFLIVISSSPGRGMRTEKKLLSTQMWENLNRFYAQFFTVHVLYVNRVGFEDGVHFWGGSEIIDPHGKEIVKAAQLKEDFVTARIDSKSLKLARLQNPLLRDEKMDFTLRELNRVYEKQTQKSF